MQHCTDKVSLRLPTQGDIDKFQSTLISWYEVFGRDFYWRKRNISLYKKIISEVLLQRTRAETVALFFPVFIKRFPSWESLDAPAPSQRARAVITLSFPKTPFLRAICRQFNCKVLLIKVSVSFTKYGISISTYLINFVNPILALKALNMLTLF